MIEFNFANAIALVVGFSLGLVYFAGLWLTVRNIADARNPGLLLLASWIGRTALVLTGLWLVSSSNLAGILVFMVGFLIARSIVIQRYKPAFETPNHRYGNGVQS